MMATSLATAHPHLVKEQVQFLEKIRDGVGPLTAALAVGWSPYKLRDQMKNKDFVELISMSKEMLTESIEEMAVTMAKRGNITAIQMYLYCQAPERGWRPPTQRVSVNQTHTVKHEVVEATRQAIVAQLETGNVADLQIGGPLDDDDIEEAEIVLDD